MIKLPSQLVKSLEEKIKIKNAYKNDKYIAKIIQDLNNFLVIVKTNLLLSLLLISSSFCRCNDIEHYHLLFSHYIYVYNLTVYSVWIYAFFLPVASHSIVSYCYILLIKKVTNFSTVTHLVNAGVRFWADPVDS